MTRTWPDLLSTLLQGQDLTSADTAWVMDQIMGENATGVQLATFAVALRAKGETAPEIEGLVASMLAHALAVQVPGRAVDIVGTGGDRANTVNISTMAAIVVAAAGAPVVKHGNRAASSKCGSADLLEGLGVRITLDAAAVQSTVAEVGIGFCFAPVFHPSFRHTAGPRREMGIPTVFNFLGPLTNPAQPTAAAIGCGSAVMAPVMADVFARRGSDVLVFRGDDGLDELTTTTTSTVWVVADGNVRLESLDPTRFGIGLANPGDLVGGTVETNVAVAQQLFAGQPGAVRDAVVLNAAAALAAHTGLGRDSGAVDLHERIAVGIERAQAAVDSGAAARLLQQWIAATNDVRHS